MCTYHFWAFFAHNCHNWDGTIIYNNGLSEQRGFFSPLEAQLFEIYFYIIKGNEETRWKSRVESFLREIKMAFLNDSRRCCRRGDAVLIERSKFLGRDAMPSSAHLWPRLPRKGRSRGKGEWKRERGGGGRKKSSLAAVFIRRYGYFANRTVLNRRCEPN